MRQGFASSMTALAIAATAVGAVISISITTTSAQAPAASVTAAAPAPAPAPALKTAWGEGDLQGIWMDETDTPLERPAKYADQEFFTEAQREELDIQRAALGGKDKRSER